MADLLKELEDDLRHQRLMQFWRRFGSYMISVSAVIVVITIGIVLWNNYRDSQNKLAAEHYGNGLELIQKSKFKEAEKSFDQSLKVGEGYGILSRLQLANLAMRKSDWATALEHYRSLREDKFAGKPFQNLAMLLEANALLASGDKAGFNELASQSEKAGFFAPYLQELQAIALLEGGKKEEAAKLFASNAQNMLSPFALKQRNQSIAETLADNLPPEVQQQPESIEEVKPDVAKEEATPKEVLDKEATTKEASEKNFDKDSDKESSKPHAE